MLCHQSQSHPSISGLFSHMQCILVICFSLCDTKNSTWSVPGASQITGAACIRLCFYLSVLGCCVKILPSTPSFSALSSHRHLILVICFICVTWRIVIWSVPDAPPTSTDLNHEKNKNWRCIPNLMYTCVLVRIMVTWNYLQLEVLSSLARTGCWVSDWTWITILVKDLRHCSTLLSFKAKLKTFLFSQYFHPN